MLAGNLIVFIATFGLVLVYALPGGAYDIVTFEAYGLLIWWALAVGIAVGILPRVRPGRLLLLLAAALLAYTAWTALSLIWTQSSELTTVEVARTLDYLGLLLLLGAVLGRDTWRAAAAGLAFGALVVCVLAVASRLDPSAFPANLAFTTLKTDRLSYPFGYWNADAAWGAMSTTIGLAWSAQDRTPWRRAIALALVPAAVLMTYLAYSRAGVIGTAIGVVLVFAISRNRFTILIHAAVAAAGSAVAIIVVRGAPQIAHATGDQGGTRVALALASALALGLATGWGTARLRFDMSRLPRRLGRGAVVGLSVAALVVAVTFGPGAAKSAWHSFKSPPVVPTGGDPAARLLSVSGTRYPVWKSALAAFNAHPLDGTGGGTFEFWWNSHPQKEDPDEFLRDAHNLWLQNMAELGLPGLLLIIAVATAAIATGVSVRRKVRRSTSAGISTAFLAVFVVFLFHASVDWMWESTAVTVLALGGIAVAGARLAHRVPRLRWWVRATLVILALGAGALQVPGLLSTTDIRSSQTAERSGNGSLALARANEAVDVEPWSASAYEQRGLVLEAAGRFGAAATALRQAISHEPTNYVHWLDLARLETQRGDIGAALSDYSRAHSLRPNSVEFELASNATRP